MRYQLISTCHQRRPSRRRHGGSDASSRPTPSAATGPATRHSGWSPPLGIVQVGEIVHQILHVQRIDQPDGADPEETLPAEHEAAAQGEQDERRFGVLSEPVRSPRQLGTPPLRVRRGGLHSWPRGRKPPPKDPHPCPLSHPHSRPPGRGELPRSSGASLGAVFGLPRTELSCWGGHGGSPGEAEGSRRSEAATLSA